MTVAERIECAIRDEVLRKSVEVFCLNHGFTEDELNTYLSFGTKKYNSYEELINCRERNGYSPYREV